MTQPCVAGSRFFSLFRQQSILTLLSLPNAIHHGFLRGHLETGSKSYFTGTTSKYSWIQKHAKTMKHPLTSSKDHNARHLCLSRHQMIIKWPLAIRLCVYRLLVMVTWHFCHFIASTCLQKHKLTVISPTHKLQHNSFLATLSFLCKDIEVDDMWKVLEKLDEKHGICLQHEASLNNISSLVFAPWM